MNAAYADLIKHELDEEASATSDLRSRALTIVTTSGGLVTLLSGLVAIAAGGSKTWRFPGSAHASLVVALVFFVLAAALALWIHFPRDVQRASTEALEALLEADDSDEASVEAIADLRITTLKSVRSLNGERAWFLLSAISAEIVAIAATGYTAWRVIDSL